MNFRLFEKLMIAIALAGLSFAARAQTQPPDNNAEFNQIQSLYAHRDSVDQRQTMDLVDDLAKRATGQMLFDVYILGSGAAWWQAQAHTPSQQAQMDLYVRGQNYASQAVNVAPQWSTGYMWRAYNLGSYALLEGKMKAFLNGDGKKIETDLLQAKQLKTEDGQPGESDDDYGPDRVLGKYYVSLDFIPGNYERGMALLKTAYDHKLHALNYVFYAEGLAQGGCQQKELAKQVLQELLSTNPNQFDPYSLGELQYNLSLGRDLLNSLQMPPNNDIGDTCI